MESTDNWLSMVKKLLKNSPLGASVCFGFIQFILEKLVEVEFSCPCHSSYNHSYGSAVFIAPTIIVFLLMCAVSYSLNLCKRKSICESLTIMIVPAITWVIIVLIDGRYYACTMTDWSGKYELIENTGPQKWCKPSNSSQEQKLLARTQLLYSYSQYVGFYTALGLTLFYVACFIGSQCCSSPPENSNPSRTV